MIFSLSSLSFDHKIFTHNKGVFAIIYETAPVSTSDFPQHQID